MVPRGVLSACVWVWAAGLAPAQPDQPQADEGAPLRYAWRVGDHLLYERREQVSALDMGQARHHIVDQIQIWCLARDGSETLLLLDLTRTKDGKTQPARGTLVYLDSLGRRRLPDVVRPRAGELDPAFAVLPELRPAMALKSTWTTSADLYGRRQRCTRIGRDARAGGHVRVDSRLDDPTGVADFLEQSESGSFWFDPSAGVVTRVEHQGRDNRAGTSTRAITVLRERRRLDAGWCARRALEARDFLRTLRHEDRFLKQLIEQPAQAAQTFKQLNRLWEEFVVGLRRESPSPFRRLGAAQARHLAAQRKRLRGRVWLGRHWFGQAAADWSLQDPAGNTINSDTLRDRYVVECFWSAESVDSLRTFETLRRLQRELADKPIHVVCLNLDRDIELARRAAQQCARGLTTVLVGPPLVGEAPPELPALRLLDQQGRIVGVFVGWRPSLADEVASRLPE